MPTSRKKAKSTPSPAKQKAHSIVCFGDSITYPWADAEIDRWSCILQFALEAEFPGKYKVYNRGIGGNTTAQALDRIEIDVARNLPGTVLVEFGLNDSVIPLDRKTCRVSVQEFEKNLIEIHRYLKEKNSHCVFIANHDTWMFKTVRGKKKKAPRLQYYPYHRAIASVARRLKAPLIDISRELRRMGLRPDDILSEDGVHLSPEGNHTYAKIVFHCLKDILAARRKK